MEASSYVQQLEEFLNDKYKKDLERLAESFPDKKSLEVDYKVLEEHSPDLADDLIDSPETIIRAAEQAVQGMQLVNPQGDKVLPNVRFFNNQNKILIRNINSKHINKLITIDGVLNKITDVRPKIEIATFQCKHCGRVYKMPQKQELFGKLSEPVQCSCERKEFQLMLDETEFVDMQKMQVQEPLEALVRGEQAKNIDVWMEDDLCNKLFPGDKVEITGILKLIPPKHKSSVYNIYIHAVHIQTIEKEFEDIELTEDEEEEIKELAKDPKIYEKIVGSIAPSIYGHNEIKEALALQLFGGTKNKVLPDGVKMRPDIHVLLIGDPGSGKSQLLYYIYQLSPKGVFVGGKSATGAGLCVSKDSIVQLNDAGMKEIQEVVEKDFEPNHEKTGAFSSRTNLNVISLDENIKTNYSKASKVWKIIPPKKLVEVITESGKTITLTPNTPLMTIKDGKLVWEKSSELKEEEFIATSRKVIPIKGKEVFLVDLLESDSLRVSGVNELIIEITEKLSEKYSGLNGVAIRYGVSADRFYRWRSKKWGQSPPLKLVKSMAVDAGFSSEKLSEEIKNGFYRYGKQIIIPKKLTPGLAYLVGLIAGDGDVQLKNGRGVIRFHNSDRRLLKKCSSIVEKELGIKTELIEDKKRVSCVRFNSKLFVEVLNALGVPAGKKSNKVNIPNLLSSSKHINSYLKGYFDCDGFVSERKTKGSHSVGVTTTSKKLVEKIKLILERYGVHSKIKVRDKTTYKQKIRSKLLQYELVITGKENMELFEKHVGFSHSNKKQKIKRVISSVSKANTNKDVIPGISSLLQKIKTKYKLTEKRLPKAYCDGNRKPSREMLIRISKHLPKGTEKELIKKLGNSDVYWEKIKEKNYVTPKDKWVYDFTIEKNHAFLANGIYVHNTATAEKDEFGEGGWTLKAGALVLASGGMAAIDEFDKMGEEDRSSMHEAMEQQRISIAKAGIVTTFRSETSILAAANPKYGRFDPFTLPAEQFNIPPTLISRFDLIFPIKDIQDETKDRALAQHILNGHQFAGANQKKGIISEEKIEELKEKATPIIPPDLFRKYVAYARKTVSPVLTHESMDKIREYYVNLREMGKQQGAVAATARQLEALVRLAEASAKGRLSKTVDIEDAERALKLHMFVMREIGMDKETGRFDVDIIATGTTKSRMDKVRSLYHLIQSLTKEYDEVTHDMIADKCEEAGIEKKELDRYLTELKKGGDIYSPKHGVFRTANER